MGFAVAFHHMGRFERNRGLKYVGVKSAFLKGSIQIFCHSLKH